MHDDSPTFDIMDLAAVENDGSIDDVLRALSNHRVRYVLYYLHGLNSDDLPLSLTQLADVVTAWRATETDTVATEADRDHMRIHLYHVSLPKLDNLGYLTFDTDTNTITDIDIPPIINSILELDSE